MKKLVAFIMSAVLAVLCIPTAVCANTADLNYNNNMYRKALAANDYNNIIYYGQRVADIEEWEPESQGRNDVLISTYQNIAFAYAKLGYLPESIAVFWKIIELADSVGGYGDYIRTAKSRIRQYTTDIRLYTDCGDNVFYNAKNEPENGVFFGLCEASLIMEDVPDYTMMITYNEIGESTLFHHYDALENAEKRGSAIEFALNCPHQGDDIRRIRDFEEYLTRISDIISLHPTVPVMMRFGAEFDIWENPASPEEYKDAYKYVTEFFRSRNENVAMVWSPNQVSSGYVNIDDFYPGDEYVDWIGVSLYAMKYFIGDPNQPENNSFIFNTGDNCDPVKAIEELAKKYGCKKPMMISESGASHFVFPLNENTHDFAMKYLRMYYSYLPMVYPELKMIAHFDYYASGEINDYRLYNNDKLKNEYVSLTRGDRFIKGNVNNFSKTRYREMTETTSVGETFPVSCYAHIYGENVTEVKYYIDEKLSASSKQVPYTGYIDARNLSGVHNLKCEIYTDKGNVYTKEGKIKTVPGIMRLVTQNGYSTLLMNFLKSRENVNR